MKKRARNCKNAQKYKHLLLLGKREWLQVSSQARHVLKIADMKFMACPVSSIPRKSWELLALITDMIDRDNNIIHLPDPEIGIMFQPPWFRAAVHIVRTERTSKWLAEKIRLSAEKRQGG